MPETYDFSGDTESSQYREESNKYLQDVKAYLSKVEAGRSLLSVDPNQPALGVHAETLRQGYAVDRANSLAARHEKLSQGAPQDTPQNEQNAPQSYDLGEPDTNPQVYDFSASEAKPERSRGIALQLAEKLAENKPLDKPFHPHQILDLVMQPIDPTVRENLVGQSGLEYLNPKTWTPSNIGKSLAGTAIDTLLSPLTYLGSPLVGSVAKGLVPRIPVSPVVPLSQADLDMQVAQRAVTKPAFETGAYPDAELVPPTVRETGKTLITPNLNPGELTTSQTVYPIAKKPMLQGGEYEPGEQGGQTSLLGGHNVLGSADYLTGKSLLAPGEQLPTSALPLRPQLLRNPEIAGKTQQAYSDFITKALKTRLLTPQMEKDLATNPLEQGGAPIELQYSKGGSVSAGPRVNETFKLPNDLTVANTADGAVFPSKYARGAGSVIDSMRASGPLGNSMADLFDTAYSNRAIGTSQDMLAATNKLDSIFGQQGLASRVRTGLRQLTSGENPFIFGGKKYWGYNDKIEEQIFNDMYTGGRMRATDPKAQAAADTFFEHGTYPASSDPGVRMLTITNPFTGKQMPLGNPSKFMPQQPVHPITSKALNDTQWGILYQRAGGEQLGISLDTYKKTIVKLSQHDPEVTGAKMKGLENMRLLDLEALGGSPYQWAKKLGYETDPFRASFRFNSLARLRGQLKQIEEPVNQLLARIPAQSDEAGKWLHLAADRAMMNPGKYDALTTTTNSLKGLSHLMDISMLQLGGLANMAQASFIAARGGGRATIKGLLDMATGTDRELLVRSGSLFPAALNEMTNPTGPMSVFSSGAYRLYGLSLIDRNTRVFAGHVGNQFVKQLESNLLADPSNKKLQGLISELGGDPKVLLQQGTIPDQMRLSMIQRFANHTAGVTDVRGTPLWASSENPWARLVNKYRTFAVANSAEVRRLVLNAPTPAIAAQRVATLLASAYVVGGGINEMRKGLRDMLMGEEARPSKQGIARHAERLVQGLGTIEGMFLVNAANDPTTAVLSAVGGPGAGVAASLVQDLQSTARHGLGWRTIDTVSKRIPIVGPVTGPLVGKEVRKETRQTTEDSRLLKE